jgi:hypothetical protein
MEFFFFTGCTELFHGSYKYEYSWPWLYEPGLLELVYPAVNSTGPVMR